MYLIEDISQSKPILILAGLVTVFQVEQSDFEKNKVVHELYTNIDYQAL